MVTATLTTLQLTTLTLTTLEFLHNNKVKSGNWKIICENLDHFVWIANLMEFDLIIKLINQTSNIKYH